MSRLAGWVGGGGGGRLRGRRGGGAAAACLGLAACLGPGPLDMALSRSGDVEGLEVGHPSACSALPVLAFLRRVRHTDPRGPAHRVSLHQARVPIDNCIYAPWVAGIHTAPVVAAQHQPQGPFKSAPTPPLAECMSNNKTSKPRHV